MNNREIGDLAEGIAEKHLINLGYEILERNWRFKRAEVDIIAKIDKTLIFIEVKYRSYDYFGPPEIAVTKKKENLLLDAGAAYAESINHDWAVRFDIIAIVKKGDKYDIKHYEDAFFPTW